MWKPTGSHSVRLHHIGWTFDPTSNTATANGTFTLDEENTVSNDCNSYTGTFTFKTFDLNGSRVWRQPVRSPRRASLKKSSDLAPLSKATGIPRREYKGMPDRLFYLPLIAKGKITADGCALSESTVTVAFW